MLRRDFGPLGFRGCPKAVSYVRAMNRKKSPTAKAGRVRIETAPAGSRLKHEEIIQTYRIGLNGGERSSVNCLHLVRHDGTVGSQQWQF